jgi:group II intron reverse transcriptase/maturase
MRTAEAILTIIQDRGKRNLKLDGIYRQLYNPELYLRAYGRLYRNDGSMTPGTTEETVDGMSMNKIQDIIELLRNERYHWTPVRRLMIPKGNGKSRPLGIPTWSDKMLQEVMRSLMEAYYEPRFNPSSHGFRPERGCHTALREVFFNWTGSKWYIEGDIKGCFDNIDHTILLTTLREHITDNRFLILVERLLQAGYLEQWKYRPTPSGTPQGGIISPLLANIYLDQLDQFVETTLIPEYTKGDIRRINPEYKRAHGRYQYHKKKGVPESILAPLRKVIRQTPNVDPNDPGYRRLRYIRYADDFLLGFNGPRDEAEEIKERLKEGELPRLQHRGGWATTDHHPSNSHPEVARKSRALFRGGETRPSCLHDPQQRFRHRGTIRQGISRDRPILRIRPESLVAASPALRHAILPPQDAGRQAQDLREEDGRALRCLDHLLQRQDQVPPGHHQPGWT